MYQEMCLLLKVSMLSIELEFSGRPVLQLHNEEDISKKHCNTEINSK